MGSGPRFSAGLVKGFAIGMTFCDFPYKYSFQLYVGPLFVFVGLGKAYDE